MSKRVDFKIVRKDDSLGVLGMIGYGFAGAVAAIVFLGIGFFTCLFAFARPLCLLGLAVCAFVVAWRLL